MKVGKNKTIVEIAINDYVTYLKTTNKMRKCLCFLFSTIITLNSINVFDYITQHCGSINYN